MKTKIAEAMMFGLPIIGTKESFEGYSFDHNIVGIETNSDIEMIEFIHKLDSDRVLLKNLSDNARDVFERNYSIQSSMDKVLKFMDCV